MLRKDGPGAAYSLGIIVRGPVLLSLALRVYREGCTYRTRSLRGGPRYDIGSLIGQIPEKNALLRPPSSLSLSLSLPLSLSLSLSLSHHSAHTFSLTRIVQLRLLVATSVFFTARTTTILVRFE